MKGKRVYLAADVAEAIEHHVPNNQTLSEYLRVVWELPEPEPKQLKPQARPKARPRDRFRYVVSDLAVGDSRIFPWGTFKSYNSVFQSVTGQYRKYGISCEINWHEEGIKVTRKS